MSVLPKKKGELGYACVKCGRTRGYEFKRKRRIWSATTTKSRYKTKKDYRGDAFQVPIEPKLHQYKYSSGFMQIFGPSSMRIAPEKHPVINPLPATPARRANFQNSKMGIALQELNKDILTFGQMILDIEERFPILFQKIENNFATGLSFWRKIRAYEKDDRYKRNFFEWFEICQSAKEKSAAAASREYYGTTPNGQKVRLSPSHIKKRCVEIEKLANDGLTYFPMLAECMDLTLSLIETDPVLSRRYKELEREYNKKVNKSSEHLYLYYIRHYDADLYKKQTEDHKKEKRKSRPDGIIECGPFRLSDFPAGFKMKQKS